MPDCWAVFVAAALVLVCSPPISDGGSLLLRRAATRVLWCVYAGRGYPFLYVPDSEAWELGSALCVAGVLC